MRQSAVLAAILSAWATSATAQPDTPQPPAATPAAPSPPVEAAATPPPVPVVPEVTWQVERRFRLWDIARFNDADRTAAEALYQSLQGPLDPGAAHDQIVAFLKTHRTLQSDGYWDAKARHFKPGLLYAKAYIARIGLTNGASFPGQTCAWSTTAGQLNLATAPCDNSVTVTLPALKSGEGSSSATVTVTTASGGTRTLPVRVRDRLVVSFGDSFASGEGNPDVPANLAALTGGWGGNGSAAYKQVWVGRDSMNGVKGPGWIDPGCHRSSLNQHLVTALKYSADRPHEAVTFLSYACSGAAVFNGLLTPQRQPPGYRDNVNVQEQDVSQVEMAVQDLCPLDAAGNSTATEIAPRTFQKRIKTTWIWDKPWQPVQARAFACSGAGIPRRVDAVLLSDGGNDAGFGSVITWALLPKAVSDPRGMILLTYLRTNVDIARSPPDAASDIGQTLSPNLQTLAARLSQFAPNAPVIAGGYPSPVRDTNHRFCGPILKTQPGADKDSTAARLVAVIGAVPPNPLGLQSWKVLIDQQDGAQIEPVVVTALNNQLETTSAITGWKFVVSGAQKAGDHGWCAGDPVAENAVLPDYSSDAAAWAPWEPFKWDPYVRRARFFRTPNDSALTELPENPRPINPVIDAILDNHQRALLAGFAGSFHPTFQAHVVMGLDLANELEQDLPAPP